MHEGLYDLFEDELAGVEVKHMIYPQEETPGYEVIAASDLPLDVGYSALVTPDGRYHAFWCSKEPMQEIDARIEELTRKHSDCLAVVCKAHV